MSKKTQNENNKLGKAGKKGAGAREGEEKMKRKSGLTGRNARSRFEAFAQTRQNKRQLGIAREYVENFDKAENRGGGLLLYGDAGTGKTFLACCIGNALLESGHSVYFTTAEDLIEKVRAYRRGGGGENPLRLIEKADLFILDDLNAQRRTDYAMEIIFSAIDARYTAMKPMLISTNMGIRQMEGASTVTGRRVFTRVLQCCLPVECTGNAVLKTA